MEQKLITFPSNDPIACLYGWSPHGSTIGSANWEIGTNESDLKYLTKNISTIESEPRNQEEIIQVDYETNTLFEPILNATDKKTPIFMRTFLEKIPENVFKKHLNKERPFDLKIQKNTNDQKRHKKNIELSKEFIRKGDIFQINLCRQIKGTFQGCARTLAAKMLRYNNPQFGCYLEQPLKKGWRIIISLSPECFLKKDIIKNTLSTYPMKGTLGGDKCKEDLLKSNKDLAELNMITDLMRNDLGKISIPNGVNVLNPRKITKHSTVWQTTSEIEASIQKNLSGEKILQALFPPGSITGAPKIHAMKLIRQLESFRRGPYCGCLFFLPQNNGMLASVLIRTLVIQVDQLGPSAKGTATYGVGGGITLQSNADDEWEETIIKSKTLSPFISSNSTLHN